MTVYEDGNRVHLSTTRTQARARTHHAASDRQTPGERQLRRHRKTVATGTGRKAAPAGLTMPGGPDQLPENSMVDFAWRIEKNCISLRHTVAGTNQNLTIHFMYKEGFDERTVLLISF